MKKIALAAAVATVATSSNAGPIGTFEELIVFGDSLSDAGNAFAMFGELAGDPDFYAEGQFTNADVWAKILEDRGASVTNYAFGGATAVTDADPDKDFEAQRADYFADFTADPSLVDNALTAVFFGGNDLRTANTPEEVGAVIVGAMTALGQGIGELASTGLSDFIVFGLPNLGRIPPLNLTPDDADNNAFTGATLAFNNALTSEDPDMPGLIPSLSASLGINIQYFDTFAFLEEQIALAEVAGINTLQSCEMFITQGCGPETVGSFPVTDEDGNTTNGFVFYDSLHPTDIVHSALADALTDQLTPIPLPAGAPLLLVALAGLGVASRRRVAGRSD